MSKAGIAILGYGTVGGGTYDILTKNGEKMLTEYGIDATVKKILVRSKDKALTAGIPAEILTTDINEIINDKSITIVAECIGGIEPAKSYILKCLDAGKNIVTANKELLAKHWAEIEKMAEKSDCGVYFEATCGGGIPVIRTMTQGMQANNIKVVKGIINGTTNYILSRMTNEGADYFDVLKDAQALGFAEANPSADVDGFDAMYKLSILSTLAFNRCVSINNIYREGISNVSAKDIEIGKEFGLTVKLLAIAKEVDGKIEARVHPVFLENSHPLASVSGSFNAIYLVGDNVGDVMLYGRGAGALPTGSAVVSDIVFCARQIKHARYNEIYDVVKPEEMISNFESEYYIRLSVYDTAGVMADITRILASNNISITRMKQDGNGDIVQVIICTHICKEESMNNALKQISNLKSLVKCESRIRIEK